MIARESPWERAHERHEPRSPEAHKVGPACRRTRADKSRYPVASASLPRSGPGEGSMWSTRRLNDMDPSPWSATSRELTRRIPAQLVTQHFGPALGHPGAQARRRRLWLIELGNPIVLPDPGSDLRPTVAVVVTRPPEDVIHTRSLEPKPSAAAPAGLGKARVGLRGLPPHRGCTRSPGRV